MTVLRRLGATMGVLATALACSSDDETTGDGSGGSSSTTGGASATGGDSSGGATSGSGGATTSGGASGGGGSSGGAAAAVARRLGREPYFLIGMGNDLADDHDQDGAYTLGVTLDLHYAYLVGLIDQGGWPDWNADGSFVNILTDSADRNGVVPMFTLWAVTAWGENNIAVLTDDAFMGPYWQGVELMYERLALFGKPAVVHLEPDFWGFAQQASPNGDPTQLAVNVSGHATECADQPDNLVGMGGCMVALARAIAPEVVVGFHASRWADPSVSATASFLVQVGAAGADIVVIETLDRDAGCFEAGNDPSCTRDDGPWYWDETNQTSPTFHEHLDWAKGVADGVGRPLLWWQMPFGVPSDTPGGSPGQYRDNRVKYLFDHPDEFVAAGGLGATFGVGAGNQTYIDSDGGQFRDAVTAYYQSPEPL